MKKGKVTDCLFVMIVLAFMVVPLLFMNTKQDVKSDFDNRALVEFPEIDDSGFEGKVEKYLQDRIGFRDQMVTGFQLLNDKVGGELRHPIYTYGENGYIFFSMSDTIQYGSFHKTFAEAVLKMQEYCESRGVKFYFLFDPEKKAIYRRFLPKGVNYSDQWVDEMFAYMSELGVNYIDNRSLLYDLSFEEQVFNQKYDAGHWNDLGCFYGTNNLWKRIHEDYPEVSEYSFDDFTISSGIGQYLASSKFPVNEEIPVFNINTKYENITGQYSDIRLNKSYRYFQYYVNLNEDAEKYPRMLIFHGSYYNRNPKFFIGRTQEYIGVHDYQNVIDLDYYFNIFQPDLVVFEAAQYTFNDQYFNSGRMAAIDYNPGLVAEDQSTEEAIRAAREQAEEFSFESDVKLNVISGEGFDTVYFERALGNVKYSYLFTDHEIYDIRKDSFGIYSAGVPSGEISEGDTVTIYYQDYLGKTFFVNVLVQKAEQSVQSIKSSDGVSYNSSSKQYTFMTEVKKNVFDAVNLQLLEGLSGTYLKDICSRTSTGTYTSSFLNLNETGWYRLRLKANSNLQDESVEIYTYLIKGQRYYYSFDVGTLTKKKAVVSNFQFFGPCPYTLGNFEQMEEFSLTEGTRLNEGIYVMHTELEDNVFSSVILQMINRDTNELNDPLSVTTNNGKYQGIYYHKAPSANYSVWLRANSNQKDEYISTSIYLEDGMMYHWSYEVTLLDQKEVQIKDFSFVSLGTE